MSLVGAKILITRAEHQSKDLVGRLKELGAQPIEMPVIEIRPPDSWDELDEAIAKLDGYDWIVLASANAVNSFVERIRERKALFEKPRIAVIGKSTEQVALQNGLNVAFKPDSFVAESFVRQFPDYPHLAGRKILWPRTNVGRNYLYEQFTAAGAQVDVVAAYKTCLPQNVAALSEMIHNLLAENKLDIITVASTQTVANLAAIIGHKWAAAYDLPNSDGQNDVGEPISDQLRERICAVLKNVAILSIGPETSLAARQYLGKLDLQADPHNTEGMISALIKHFGS